MYKGAYDEFEIVGIGNFCADLRERCGVPPEKDSLDASGGVRHAGGQCFGITAFFVWPHQYPSEMPAL